MTTLHGVARLNQWLGNVALLCMYGNATEWAELH